MCTCRNGTRRGIEQPASRKWGALKLQPPGGGVRGEAQPQRARVHNILRGLKTPPPATRSRAAWITGKSGGDPAAAEAPVDEERGKKVRSHNRMAEPTYVIHGFPERQLSPDQGHGAPGPRWHPACRHHWFEGDLVRGKVGITGLKVISFEARAAYIKLNRAVVQVQGGRGGGSLALERGGRPGPPTAAEAYRSALAARCSGKSHHSCAVPISMLCKGQIRRLPWMATVAPCPPTYCEVCLQQWRRWVCCRREAVLSGMLAREWARGQSWAELDFTGVHFTQESCDACLAALEQVQSSAPHPPITCGDRTRTCACPATFTLMVVSSDRDTASDCLMQSVF